MVLGCCSNLGLVQGAKDHGLYNLGPFQGSQAVGVASEAHSEVLF